jgi:hypothetical protein
MYLSLKDPLRSIRLLTILPAQPDNVLRLTTSTSEIVTDERSASHLGTYVALSYTWGPPSTVYPVLVDGQVLDIRENLWLLLHEMQKHEDKRSFWADAICINQADIAEKNSQVSIMGLIFGQASEVIIWLGKGAVGTREALSLADRYDWDQLRSLHPLGVAESAAALSEINHELVTHLDAFHKLCCRQYWTRTWIIQEVYLARGRRLIRCGSETIFFNKFCSLFLYVGLGFIYKGLVGPQFKTWEWKDFQSSSAHTVITDYAEMQRGSPLLLEQCICRYVRTKCLDPRDKVYAFLSIANDITTSPIQLKPRYSTEVADLFWQTLNFCRSVNVSFAATLRKALSLDIGDITSWPSTTDLTNPGISAPITLLGNGFRVISVRAADDSSVSLFDVAGGRIQTYAQGFAFGKIQEGDMVLPSALYGEFDWILTFGRSHNHLSSPTRANSIEPMGHMAPKCLCFMGSRRWEEITPVWHSLASRKAREAQKAFLELKFEQRITSNGVSNFLHLDRAAILFLEQYDNRGYFNGPFESGYWPVE